MKGTSLFLAVMVLGRLAVAQCVLPPVPAREYINDRQIEATLQTEMVRMVKSKHYVSAKGLRAGASYRGKVKCNLPATETNATSLSAVYGKCRDGVVIVGQLFKCRTCSKWHVGATTGFFITEDGVFVTNYHVMFSNDTAEVYTVMTREGKIYPVKAILTASKSDDVALCKVDGNGFTPIPVRGDAPVGAPIAVLGHMDESFYSLTSGIISRYFIYECPCGRPHDDKGPRMAITADYAKGSSGSPVLDMNGNAVGVASQTHSIYYEQPKDGTKGDLQAVIKTCVPAEAILKLVENTGR